METTVSSSVLLNFVGDHHIIGLHVFDTTKTDKFRPGLKPYGIVLRY